VIVVDDPVYLQRAAAEGRALLVAAECDWARPVPHCPEWNAADLVRHMGGIFAWMATIVSTGERASFRQLDRPPAEDAGLRRWYLDNLTRTIGVLTDADPEAKVWTFSSLDDYRAGWWWRRLAVEVSIHRWDSEHAAAIHGGPRPRALDADVAAAGIAEFVTEFLPGLLTRDTGDGLPTGTVHLHASDAASDTWLDLAEGRQVDRLHTQAATSIEGTRSDILLWLTNREPESLNVNGDRGLLTQWTALRR
jgi:uncharacterized protein (TIGR03083 family)